MDYSKALGEKAAGWDEQTCEKYRWFSACIMKQTRRCVCVNVCARPPKALGLAWERKEAVGVRVRPGGITLLPNLPATASRS